MADRCLHCRFFLKETNDGGKCRRRSMQVITWSDRDYSTGAVINSSVFDWPHMAADQWCGEWEKAGG